MSAKSLSKKALGVTADIPDLESLSEENVRSLKKTQLKEVLENFGLPKTGSVADLRDRILDYKRSKKASTTEGKEDDEAGENELHETRSLGNAEEDLRNRTLDHKRSKKVPTAEGKDDEKGQFSASTLENESAVGDLRSKKRRKWRISDPAHIAPNCYHRDVFAANFPLVKVVDVPPGVPFPVHDKFEGNLLDAEATTEARKRWIQRYFEVDHTYCMAENEQQAFPQQFAFMESLMQFTIPSRQDVQIHNERCLSLKRKWSFEELQAERKRRKLDADCEENAGFRIVPDTVEVQGPLGPNRSDGDNEGMKISTEEIVKLTGDLEEDVDTVTGFADGVLHVMDYRPLERSVHKFIHDLNPDRVVAIVERKFVDDLHKWNARFQGGFYAVKHCMVNLQRGHGAPVYVLIMTSSLWSYGILVPEGYVQIRDGKVDVKCMPEFNRHQAITGVSATGFEKLQEKLKEGTEFYRRNYRENPQVHYRDGPMLVGTYYLSPRWFSLPKPEPGNGKLEAVRRLFDGLMRLVLGDSVIDWKSEDYEWRWQLRERMLREEIDVWC